MSKRITSLHVAKRAQVSQSTVSRVFSKDSPNVAPATRERVLQAAQELGYRPNVIARMMSRRQTNIIGIVMADVTSPFYARVLDKFLQRFQAMHKQVLLFTAGDDESLEEVLPLVLQYQVDGLIITSATLSSHLAEECARVRTPVVLFNRRDKNSRVSSVCADNVAGGRLVADVLLDSGHTCLAYIAGPSNTSTSNDRERGFNERLTERGHQRCERSQATYTYASGYQSALGLLRRERPPDAIFCANDILALGAIDAIRSQGLRVPQDVSVIGFDNIPMASWGAYDLTTVSQQVDEMINCTIDILLKKLAHPHSSPVSETVAGHLIMRGTVKGINRKHVHMDH